VGLGKSKAPSFLSKEERSALDELTVSLTPLPELKRRYWMAAFLVVSHGIASSILAILKPEVYVHTLISPSIDGAEFLVRNTRVRGVIGFSLILGWLVFRNNEKWASRIITFGIVFVIVSTLFFYVTLIRLGAFESTASTLLFTVWRPILLILLFILRARMRDYLRDLKKLEARTPGITSCPTD
jgi:hypothetical protein